MIPSPGSRYRPLRPVIDEDRLEYPLQDEDRPYTYLGTHEVSWLARPEFGGSWPVPLFISHRRLAPRRTLPRARTPWALDSGGFTELSMHGEWRTHPLDYAAAARRYDQEIGGMEWCSPQDWMCEPFMLARTGLTVADHQARTVANYLDLRYADDCLPWIPVLQGWTRDDYLRCVEMYAAAGIDLSMEPLVGIGSVCRRQTTGEAVDIIRTLRDVAGVSRIHGFGFKTTGLRAAHQLLQSSDSMAWSYDARRNPPLPGCTHETCANCPRYALAWRQRLLAGLPDWHQLTLEIAA